MNKPNRKKVFLLLSTLPWRFDLKYLQNLAIELSKYGTVIYYYPPQKPVNVYKPKQNKSEIEFLRTSLRSYFQPLTIFVPFTIIPFCRFPFVTKINTTVNILLLKTLLAIKAIGKISYLFVTYPFDQPLIQSFSGYKIIYDCMDIPRNGTNREDDRRIWNNHKQLCKIADYIFVNSASMRSFCSRYSKNIFTVPSGFVFDEFNREAAKQPPRALSKIRRPIAGFIGLTFVHLDIPLLLQAIPRCTNVSFVFVGPTFGLTKFSNTSRENYLMYKTLWKKLLALPNVYHVGKQNRRMLGAYINAFDVCIIPYDLKQKSALYANAIKAYEYLYFGKRIVSTPLKPLKGLSSYISFAKTPKTFSKAIRNSLHTSLDGQEINDREQIANSHDIQHKTGAILSALSTKR